MAVLSCIFFFLLSIFFVFTFGYHFFESIGISGKVFTGIFIFSICLLIVYCKDGSENILPFIGCCLISSGLVLFFCSLKGGTRRKKTKGD